MTKQIHPFLFAIYPVLFLYSNNVHNTEPSVVWKPLLLTLCFTALIWIALRYTLRKRSKVGVFSSLIVLLFYSYGHVHDVLGRINIALFGGDTFLTSNVFLLTVWGAIFLLGFYYLVRTKRDLGAVTNLLNIVSVTLVTITILSIVGGLIKTAIAEREERDLLRLEDDEAASLLMPESQPDIYYIILDGYMRSDTQLEVYGHDNSQFTEFLTDNGFYIASRSHSNYPITLLSLSSSLNMQQLDSLTAEFGRETTDKTLTYPLIRNHRVGQIMKSIGYRYVQIGSWYGVTHRSDIADEMLYGASPEDRFMGLLYDSTVMYPLTGEVLPQSWQFGRVRYYPREAVLYAFDALRLAGNRKQPTFVFAHIISPHFPYVFSADGGPARVPDEDWTEMDAYFAQIEFVNDKVEELVEQLLAESNTPPIIVLQSDHGWPTIGGAQPSASDLKSVFRNLNAYYLPGEGGEALYESITPVNTFRLIFNTYFGGDYDLLDDDSFYSDHARYVFDFTNVTDLLEQ